MTALRFPRNFGSHVAIAAGIDYCRGDAAIVMAADLQDPPALIRDFVDRWREASTSSGARAPAATTAPIAGMGDGDFYRWCAAFAIPTYPPRRDRQLLSDFPPGHRRVPAMQRTQPADVRADRVERIS